jgi:hypothetical protein
MVKGIILLMYILWVPLGFTSMSTINSFPMPKGMMPSIVLGGRTKFWVGKCSLVGSHELSCRIAVAKSQIGLENTPHLFGQGDPWNVRWR